MERFCKFRAGLVVLVGLIGIPQAAYSTSAGNVAVTLVGPPAVNEGQSFDISVFVRTTDPITGGQARVSFPSSLTFNQTPVSRNATTTTANPLDKGFWIVAPGNNEPFLNSGDAFLTVTTSGTQITNEDAACTASGMPRACCTAAATGPCADILVATLNFTANAAVPSPADLIVVTMGGLPTEFFNGITPVFGTTTTPTAASVEITPHTPNNTPTPIASPTETRTIACTGDCDRDGHVTIDELLTGVAIAFGTLPLNECLAVDGDTDGAVSVADLVGGVGNALSECGAAS